jgi:hypothetical protein
MGSSAAVAGPTGSATAPAGSGKPAGSGSAHAPHDAGPKETPEQKQFRVKYVLDTLKKESDLTKDHVWIPEMSKASGEHLRRAYKTIRNRELAQDDNDTATITRADAYLKKITDHFIGLMTELVAKAPVIPAAPTITSPTADVTVKVGQPVTFKFAPVKDATQYYCWFYESTGGAHYWSNWNAATKSYGTTPDCTIPGDDPKWARFHDGKAHLHGRAITLAKSPGGKDFKIWSHVATLDVTVTGGAAPAPSPSGSGANPGPKPAPSASGGAK